MSVLDIRARELLVAAKRSSTQTAYAGALRVFDKFWSESETGAPVFPVSNAVELRFVAWLSSSHPVQASTAAQYLSAVRSHGMLCATTVSEAHVSLAVKGLSLLRPSRTKADIKPTFLATSVIAAAHQLIVCLMDPNPNLRDCQSLAAVVVGFLFASRASTLCSIRPVDFSLIGSSLVLCESYRKSKDLMMPRTMQLVMGPGSPAWAISSYVSYVRLHQPGLVEQSLVSLHRHASPAARIDSCLVDVSRLTKSLFATTAPCSSHALRRGGAVSMLAVGVPLSKICEWGHWAGEASVRPYIAGRAFQQPTPADRVCFDWMLDGGVQPRR
jgi:hypothetical protein